VLGAETAVLLLLLVNVSGVRTNEFDFKGREDLDVDDVSDWLVVVCCDDDITDDVFCMTNDCVEQDSTIDDCFEHDLDVSDSRAMASSSASSKERRHSSADDSYTLFDCCVVVTVFDWLLVVWQCCSDELVVLNMLSPDTSDSLSAIS